MEFARWYATGIHRLSSQGDPRQHSIEARSNRETYSGRVHSAAPASSPHELPKRLLARKPVPALSPWRPLQCAPRGHLRAVQRVPPPLFEFALRLAYARAGEVDGLTWNLQIQQATDLPNRYLGQDRDFIHFRCNRGAARACIRRHFLNSAASERCWPVAASRLF